MIERCYSSNLTAEVNIDLLQGKLNGLQLKQVTMAICSHSNQLCALWNYPPHTTQSRPNLPGGCRADLMRFKFN